MINNFIKTFGKPEKVVICIGDWEQKKHRKFKEPTKGKGFRTLLRKTGFQTYLVDEFRTSCRCSNCLGGECSKFRKCRNQKPNKNDYILRHGVLMCKTCSALWNRDENSARNIYKIAYNAINKKERPEYLSRSQVISGTTSVGKLQCHSAKAEAT
jgi:transposase